MSQNRFRVNDGTRQALDATPRGYVSPTCGPAERIEQVRSEHGVERIHRFDLGINRDGCAPAVAGRLRDLADPAGGGFALCEYPSFDQRRLCGAVAALHDIRPEQVQVTAGIEQAIGMIAAAFLGPGDRFVVCHPSFFVFETFSARTGAQAVHLDLREADGFGWTGETLAELREVLASRRPRIVWLASPNNPTGLAMPAPVVHEVVAQAQRFDTLVVVDEAYGEYVDGADGVRSASGLLGRYPNLIVLRTFSKAYGLAGLRIGYAMAADEQVLRALRVQSTNFPVGQLSYELAACALDHPGHLEDTRRGLAHSKRRFLQALADLPGMTAVDSDCCIMMIGHSCLQAPVLHAWLEQRGVLTAHIPGEGHVPQRYLRITLGSSEHNAVLLGHLADLDLQQVEEAGGTLQEAWGVGS